MNCDDPNQESNIFIRSLKEIGEDPITIIAKNPSEQNLADTLSRVINYYIENEMHG